MTTTAFIKEQNGKLLKQLKLNRDIDAAIKAAIELEKDIDNRYKTGLKEFKQARGFKQVKNKSDFELIDTGKADYILLKRKLEKEYNEGPGAAILAEYAGPDLDKKYLKLAYDINSELINQRLLNILAAALKEFYSIDKNKNIPYHYKKVVDGLAKIINNDDVFIYYGDRIGYSEFSISYPCGKNAFTIYKSDSIRNYKLKDIELLTKKQLINRAKKAYHINDKIKVLEKRIKELKDNINTLTKYTFGY